jgi:hypothetical protein
MQRMIAITNNHCQQGRLLELWSGRQPERDQAYHFCRDGGDANDHQGTARESIAYSRMRQDQVLMVTLGFH